MEEFDVEFESICKQQPSEELLVLPGLWTANDAHRICTQLEGGLNVVTNQEDQDKVLSMINNGSVGKVTSSDYKIHDTVITQS